MTAQWVDDETFAKYRSRYSLESIAHLDGVKWNEAPLPRRWHRCEAQTASYLERIGQVRRCACGAIWENGGPWMDRNSRRRSKR